VADFFAYIPAWITMMFQADKIMHGGKSSSVWLAFSLLILIVAAIVIPHIPPHSFYQTILIAALFLGPFITLIGISNRALWTRLFLSYFISGPIRPGDPLRALGWKQGGSLEKQNYSRG
jgi:hypothetical protein